MVICSVPHEYESCLHFELFRLVVAGLITADLTLALIPIHESRQGRFWQDAHQVETLPAFHTAV